MLNKRQPLPRHLILARHMKVLVEGNTEELTFALTLPVVSEFHEVSGKVMSFK